MKFLKDDYIISIKTGIIAKIIEVGNDSYKIDFMDRIWGQQYFSKDQLDKNWDIAYSECSMKIIHIKCSCGATKTYGKLSPIRNHTYFCEIHNI